MSTGPLLAPIQAFLACEIPGAWVAMAHESAQLPALLIGHAGCELKAVRSAQALIWKYGSNSEDGKACHQLLNKMSKLAPYLDDELKSFYESLLKSESRHFQGYLKLANSFPVSPLD